MSNTVHHGTHRFTAPVDFDDAVTFGAAVEFSARASGMVDGIVFVDNVDRLPAAVAGARTLAADTWRLRRDLCHHSGTTAVTATDLQVLIAGVTG